MKKFYQLTVLIGLMAFSLQSQAQVRFGVKAGLNLNNISQNVEDSDFEFATKMSLGYHIGATMDFALFDDMSLQTGLLFTRKGFNNDLEEGFFGDDPVDGYDRNFYHYLEIPIHVAYKINSFQLYAGPYVALGLGGKNKYEYTEEFNGMKFTESGELKLKPAYGKLTESDFDDLEDDEDYINGLDMGINFGVGYQTGPVLINAGYSLGLTNLTPRLEGFDEERDAFKLTNRVISVSLSYFFGTEQQND